MLVLFELNVMGSDEVIEFDDNATIDEINAAYDEWVSDLASGWSYYEE